MDVDLILWVIAVVLIFAFIFYSITYKTKSEKEEEKRLEESLEDEFIIDPETGVKMTIDQAESGQWIEHNNKDYSSSDNEEVEYLNEYEKRARKALDYLRTNEFYTKIILSEGELNAFEETKILSKYDDWSYSNPYKFRGGVLILPAPEIEGLSAYEEDYLETQIMFWIKITNVFGHYYLREKTATEEIFDWFRNDDDLKLKGYESFTIEPSSNVERINKVLTYFVDQKGLEIEIDNDNLFVKTTRLFRKKDIVRIQEILSLISAI